MSYTPLSQADIKGKRVLLRAGFDLPIDNGVVQDETRIRVLLPTIKYVLDNGASLIVMAHQGRPTEAREKEFSQEPVAKALEQLLGTPVEFLPECRGESVRSAAEALQPGSVLMLENLRYEKAEKSKDEDERDAFGQELASLADVYVNDAFTNCHRDHASMTSVPKYLPSYVGLQLEQELEHLTAVTENPKKPITLIISGAKMETKVPVIKHFLDKGDHVLVGGCIANTLLSAEGYDIAESKCEPNFKDIAQEILLESEKEDMATVHIPTDVVVASEISEHSECIDLPIEDIEGDMKIADVGLASAKKYADIIAESETVIWNGPLGVYEIEGFAGSSKVVAQAMAEATQRGAVTIIGGGDTVDFLDRYGIGTKGYTFVSTGGGAMLEFIAGKSLPALKILRKN